MKKKLIVATLLAGILGVQASLGIAAGSGLISNPYIGGYDNYIEVDDQTFVMSGDINRLSTYSYDIEASSEWMGATVRVDCITYTKHNVNGPELEIGVAQTFYEEKENYSDIDPSISGYILEYAKFIHTVVGVYDTYFYATDY